MTYEEAVKEMLARLWRAESYRDEVKQCWNVTVITPEGARMRESVPIDEFMKPEIRCARDPRKAVQRAMQEATARCVEALIEKI